MKLPNPTPCKSKLIAGINFVYNPDYKGVGCVTIKQVCQRFYLRHIKDRNAKWDGIFSQKELEQAILFLVDSLKDWRKRSEGNGTS